MPEAGTLCEPLVFASGDTFKTSVGMFSWTVEGTLDNVNNTADGAGVEYKGQPMDNCDITTMFIAIDTRSWSATVITYINCPHPFPIIASTKYTTSFALAYSTEVGEMGSDQWFHNTDRYNNMTSM